MILNTMITFYQPKHHIFSIPIIVNDNVIGKHPLIEHEIITPNILNDSILDDGFFYILTHIMWRIV